MAKLVYAHDGISSYDELFLKALRERYDTYVLTFHPSPNYIPSKIKIIKMNDLIPEISIHPFEGMREHLLTPLRTRILRKNLIQIKPDVLIGCWASTYGFYSASSNFHPFLLFIWGSDILIYPKKYFPLKPFIIYSLRKADAVLVDSEVQREAAIKLGCEPRKILKFPWVNLNGFKNDEDQRRKIRKELGWRNDDVVVISLRNHRSIYGVGYLVDAIPNIVKKNKSVKFLVLGEGPQTNFFKTKLKNFIRSGQVRFVGTVPHDEVVAYLSAADIYVSTSFSDGSSASLLEAMACSLPAVVTEIKGNKEWVEEGVNGFLIPVADSEKIAERILLLANNYKLRKVLREKAEEMIRTQVNWRNNMQRLTETIDKMVTSST